MDLSSISDDELERIAQAPQPDLIGMSDEELEKIATGPDGSLVTGVRNFAQSATLGFSDEIAGAGEVLGRAVGLEGLGGPMRDIKQHPGGPSLDWEVLRDAYRQARQKERDSLKKDMADHPAISTISNLGGAIASPVNRIAPGASLAKSGAAIGAAGAAGASEDEDLLGLAKDALLGGALGGGMGKALDVASPYIQDATQKVGEAFRGFAKDRSAAAQGLTKALRKKMGNEKALEIGAGGLDEGIVTPLASPRTMLERAEAVQSRGGQMMGDVYSQIDDAGASTFNPLDVASKVDEQIGGFYRSPINRGESNQLENTLESILMRGDGNIPLKEAQVLKEELGKVANWKNNVNITDKEKMARDAYWIVSNSIDEAANTGSQTLGIEGLKETLQQGRKLSELGRKSASGLEERISQQGNNFFGLTDYITAGAGLGYGGSTGDWETAGAAFAGKKLGQKYGNQLAATAANAISKRLMQSPSLAQLAQKSPQAFQNLVQKMEQQIGPKLSPVMPKAAEAPGELDQDSGVPAQEPVPPPGGQIEPDKAPGAHNIEEIVKRAPQSLGKFATVLQEASSRGPQGMAATHFMLQQTNPEYRQMLNQVTGVNEGY